MHDHFEARLPGARCRDEANARTANGFGAASHIARQRKDFWRSNDELFGTKRRAVLSSAVSSAALCRATLRGDAEQQTICVCNSELRTTTLRQ